MYNSSIRDYIELFYDYKKSNLRYVVVSLLPFFCICLASAIFPKLDATISFFGFTVYNFNGYIIPFLMALATTSYKKTNVFLKISYFIGLGVFISIGLFCCL